MTTLRPLNCVDRLLVSGSAPTGGRARAPRNPGRLGASRVACASLIPGGASCSGREAGAYSFPKGGLGRLTWQRSRDNGGPRALKKEEEQEAELSVEEVDVGVKKGNHDVGPVVTGEGGKVAAVGWRTLVSLCTLSSVICTIDRAAMSVAILPMADEYSWSEGVKGAVSSAFFAGYTLTNFSGGYLTALFPAASLLGVGVLLWSGFTVLTPAAAATRSMPALFSTRAAMGIAEGVAFPSYTALYAKHMPKEKRSVAQALLYSGQQLGTIIALLTAPKIIEAGGWEAVFYVFGSLGIVWALVWAPSALALDGKPGSEQAEAAGVARGLRSAIPWDRITANRPAISLAMAHCSCGYGLFIYQAWLPSFCAHQYGLSVEEAAGLAIGPWLVQSVTTALAGLSADTLINKRLLSRTATRKAMQSVGSLLPATLLTLFAVSPPEDVNEAVALLTVCFAALGLQGAGFGGNHADISPRYAGAIFGVTNAMASICGTLGIYLTGILLEVTDGDWAPTFAIIAVTYVAGWAFFMAWGSGEEQDFNRL